MKLLLKMIVFMALLISAATLPAQTNAPDAPLPSLDALVSRVIEQAKKESEMEHTFKQHYSYKRSRITEYHAADGTLDSHELKTGDKHPRALPITNGLAGAAGTNSVPPVTKFGKSDLALLDRQLINRFSLTLVGRKIV